MPTQGSSRQLDRVDGSFKQLRKGVGLGVEPSGRVLA